MKKILLMLSSLTLITPVTSLVISCDNKNEDKQDFDMQEFINLGLAVPGEKMNEEEWDVYWNSIIKKEKYYGEVFDKEEYEEAIKRGYQRAENWRANDIESYRKWKYENFNYQVWLICNSINKNVNSYIRIYFLNNLKEADKDILISDKNIILSSEYSKLNYNILIIQWYDWALENYLPNN
ncbi:hypothetical protein [Mesoplasma tabanidae]|uniref:Lipoprotein n=1 Tax=Mesoplasma tabanidae TaxID=219745 RepID=A0A2K8P469_9MOLU|nr:hypothetical protein [Mesoplasma tabanidae]ATZ21547.1 hypothetical protein MTABA_v1c03440 [Mesoplasma tabanidae]